MITAEEFYKNQDKIEVFTDEKKDLLNLFKEFTNLHLDNAIKEFAEYLFRCAIDKETPMNYEEWLKQYKIKNKLV